MRGLFKILISVFVISILLSSSVFAFSFKDWFTGDAVKKNKESGEDSGGFFSKFTLFFQNVFTPRNDLPPETGGGDGPPEAPSYCIDGKNYTMRVGDSIDDEIVTVSGSTRGFDIILLAIDGNDVLIEIDGSAGSIDEGDTERINGVEIFVQEVNEEEGWAHIIICRADERVYVCEGEETFTLNTGESREVGTHTISLLSVDGNDALVEVNGNARSVDQDESERFGEVQLYVVSVIESSEGEGLVIFAVCVPEEEVVVDDGVPITLPVGCETPLREMDELRMGSIETEVRTESGRYRTFDLNLLALESDDILISVDDTTDSIDLGDLQRISGIGIFVRNIDVGRNMADIAICSARDRVFCEGEEKFTINTGEDREVLGNTVSLLAVDGNDILVEVNGNARSVDEDGSERFGDLTLHAKSVIESSEGEGLAVIIACPA